MDSADGAAAVDVVEQGAPSFRLRSVHAAKDRDNGSRTLEHRSAVLMHPQMFASLPIWLAGALLSLGAVAGAVGLGTVTRRLVPAALRTDHNEAATAILTVVGTTYAVLLAFVAMLAWESYDKATEDVASEASVVESVFDLSGALPADDRTSLRRALADYVRNVIDVEWPALRRGLPVPNRNPSLTVVQDVALRSTMAGPGNGALQALLVETDRIATAREARLRAADGSIPSVAWFVLLAGGGISVALAAMLGAADQRMHLTMLSLLALSGALVLLIVVSLSNPFRGDTAVSPLPFRQLLAAGMGSG